MNVPCGGLAGSSLGLDHCERTNPIVGSLRLQLLELFLIHDRGSCVLLQCTLERRR